MEEFHRCRTDPPQRANNAKNNFMSWRQRDTVTGSRGDDILPHIDVMQWQHSPGAPSTNID